MALVIPQGFSNWHLTIQNSSGGLSARSSIAIGLKQTSSLDQSLVGALANIMRDALTPIYDNSWLLGPTHVESSQAGFETVWDDAGTEAGTHASQAYASPAVAHVVTKVTGFRGKKFRGRFYLPGVPEADVGEDGIIAGTRVNDVQAAVDNLFNNLVATATVDFLVLFHDSESPGDHTPTQLQSFIARNVVGNMRPRQRR